MTSVNVQLINGLILALDANDMNGFCALLTNPSVMLFAVWGLKLWKYVVHGTNPHEANRDFACKVEFVVRHRLCRDWRSCKAVFKRFCANFGGGVQEKRCSICACIGHNVTNCPGKKTIL